jgi:hypothetical protein
MRGHTARAAIMDKTNDKRIIDSRRGPGNPAPADARLMTVLRSSLKNQ